MIILDLIKDEPVFQTLIKKYKLRVYGNIFYNSLNEEFGGCVDKFVLSPESFIKGDYCFSLSSEDSLYLGSSRSGTHPIYFRKINDSIVYSQKLKDVVNASPVNKLSEEGAYQFLTYEYVADPLTLIEEVYKVPSANFLYVDKYLKYKITEFKPQITDFNENFNSIEIFKDSIYMAHENRLKTESRNALLLSGGVDSCVSAIVLSNIDKNIDCFTFSTLNAEQDEYADARCTAEHLGLNLERVIIDPNEEFDLETLIYESNFFYPGAIMISAIAAQSGPGTNFFACQDTRLHTPALNQLDKFVFSISNSQREILSKAMRALPNIFSSENRISKFINRGRYANDLPKYINELFFHKHNLDLGLGYYEQDKNFFTELNFITKEIFSGFKGNSRQIYNEIVKLAWHRQYSDDIQYLLSTAAHFGSSCQMPWYDNDLAFTSAQLPMKDATKFVRGRSGHSTKPKKVNKYILRKTFDSLLPDKILFRDKAVCVTNHLYLKGVYKPYIEKMNNNSLLFNTIAGKNLFIKNLFDFHYLHYQNYQIKDYNSVVEMQNIVALELYCKVFDLG